MAEKRTIELEIQDNSKTLKQQYRDAVKELQNVAAAYGETSAEAVKAAQKAADLKDQIGFTNDLVGAFNPDAKFNSLSKSIGGVLDGFQAVQGGLGLIGVEGQAVEEAMLKVQSAMALSQGLQGLMEARDSFKQLGTVAMNALKGIRTGIAATGIGLLVIAVGLLVANFDKLKDAFSSALGKAKAFEKGVSEQAAAARDAVNNFSEYERTLRRLGKTQDEIESKRRERFKRAIEDTEKELKANKKVYQEQLKNLESVRTADKYGFNFVGRLIYGDEEDAKEQRKKVKETRAQLEKLKNDKFEFEQKIKDDAKKKREEDLQDYKDKIKEKQDLIKADLEKIRQYQLEASEANTARNRRTFEQEIYLINQKYDEQVKLAKKYKKDTTQIEQARANEIADVRKNNADLNVHLETTALNKIAVARTNQTTQLAGALNQQVELERQAAEQKIKILEAQAVRAQKIDENANSFKVKSIQQGLEIVSNLTELFGKKSEKNAKRAFQVQKAAQVASALINTYQSATGAYASQFLPVPDPTSPVRGGIAAGLAVAAGLVNVAKISSQKFEGGSTGGGGGTPGGNVPDSQMAAPQFNTIGTSGINQLATLQQQPTKAYVVSGEVTSAQSLDRNRLQNATL
jgi:hypothetical protein